MNVAKKQEIRARKGSAKRPAIGTTMRVGSGTRGTPSEKNTKLKPWLPGKWTYEADVVVAGYGGAGACAAIAAHDAGAKVIILEKAPVAGGNTGVAGGSLNLPSDVPNATEYYRALAWGTVDGESIHTLAKVMVELPHRLEEWGAKFEYFPIEAAHYPALPGSASFHQRVHLARTEQQVKEGMWWTYGDELFKFFKNQVENRKVRVMYETPAKELIQDPLTKEILGVKAEKSGKEVYIKARRGVVLACGGFENNKEMLVSFLPHMTELPIYPLGTPYNTGDGILMAAKVGAKLWHMAGVELGTFAPKAPSEKFGVGFRLIRLLPVGSQAIYVNKYGKRFMDEATLLSHRKDALKVQDFDHERAEYPNIPFYMVFDETFRKKGPIVETRYGWWCIHKLYKWSDDNSAEIDQGWIVKGNTIKELAKKIKVDPGTLEETVRKYNEHCMTGVDSKFGRPKDRLVPLETPPYYATELCEPIINTQGGPKHNAHAQVVDQDDNPIPRLYAAGELGSFFFPLYEGGSNIPEAFAFGRIAGEHTAREMPHE